MSFANLDILISFISNILILDLSPMKQYATAETRKNKILDQNIMGVFAKKFTIKELIKIIDYEKMINSRS